LSAKVQSTTRFKRLSGFVTFSWNGYIMPQITRSENSQGGAARLGWASKDLRLGVPVNTQFRSLGLAGASVLSGLRGQASPPFSTGFGPLPAR
jgi:hypothetical protein